MCDLGKNNGHSFGTLSSANEVSFHWDGADGKFNQISSLVFAKFFDEFSRMNKDSAVAPHQFGPGLNSEVDAILLLGLVLLR